MTGYFLQPEFPFCLPGRRQAYTRPPLAVKGPLRRFRALDRADPGDALFMRERGELQAGKSPPGS